MNRLMWICGLLFVFCMGQCAELDRRFIHAIHKVESGGKEGFILGDKGQALGPLQIHYTYWLDAGIVGHYQNCTNLTYSVKVMTAYLSRYVPWAIRSNNFEVLVRVHNGGPKGYLKPATFPYWERVKKFLTQ